MALVARRLAAIDHKAAFVDLLYDDLTLIASQVNWANQLAGPVFFTLVGPGGVVIASRTAQPGTSGNIAIPANRQFQVESVSALSVTMRGA